MAGNKDTSLTFAFYDGDNVSRRETITQDIVKVGKDPKSHLRVDDEQASRMHAVIEVTSTNDVTLIDLGNEAGTLVNGARVNKCKLSAGDQIRIGETLIVLEQIQEAAAVAAVPAGEAAAAAGSAPAAAAPAGSAPAAAAAPAADPASKASDPFGAAPAAASNPFAAAGGSSPAFASSNPFGCGAKYGCGDGRCAGGKL